MREPNFKLFDIHDARDLEEGMMISIDRDVGSLYGTISEAIPYKDEDRITIIISSILTDPEEKEFYTGSAAITLDFAGNKQIKVRVPLAEVLRNL